MKILLAFCLATAVAQAVGVDWATVEKMQILRKESYKPRNRSSTDTNIIGGDEAIPGQFPYQVALLITNPQSTGFCGGSILHEDWVLTAAHCVSDAVSVEIIIAAHNIVDADPHQFKVQAKRIIVHENFNLNLIANDVALLELPWPLEYSDRVQPIRLPRRSQVGVTFERETAIISGWGRDSDIHTDLSPVLRWTQNPIMDHETCSYFYFLSILHYVICMEGTEIRAPCDGDNGGPMVVVDTDGGLTLVGIISYVMPPVCTIGWPNICTRASTHLDWIETNTGGAVFVRS